MNKSTLTVPLKADNANIMSLQETYCMQAKQHQFKSSWYGLTISAHNKWVGILFNPNCNVDVISSFNSNNGRTLLLYVTIEGKPCTSMNVYAPNDTGCRTTYFNELMAWIPKYALKAENIIMFGDCNCCLNATDKSIKKH